MKSSWPSGQDASGYDQGIQQNFVDRRQSGSWPETGFEEVAEASTSSKNAGNAIHHRFSSNRREVRSDFGAWRAVTVTPFANEKYVSKVTTFSHRIANHSPLKVDGIANGNRTEHTSLETVFSARFSVGTLLSVSYGHTGV